MSRERREEMKPQVFTPGSPKIFSHQLCSLPLEKSEQRREKQGKTEEERSCFCERGGVALSLVEEEAALVFCSPIFHVGDKRGAGKGASDCNSRRPLFRFGLWSTCVVLAATDKPKRTLKTPPPSSP